MGHKSRGFYILLHTQFLCANHDGKQYDSYKRSPRQQSEEY